MKIPFKKMHGLGNDFVVIDARAENIPLTPAQSRAIADRKRGIGCDQLLVMKPASNQSADFFMEVINSDGTVDSICGNGTRCVARLFMDETGRNTAKIETGAGILIAEDNNGNAVCVNMGQPQFTDAIIPMAGTHDTSNVTFNEFPELPSAVVVNMGNPHTVFFVPDAEAVDLAAIGPHLENHVFFPKRTNVEFCHIIDAHKIRMRVWERGTGITEACGSGASSVLVAAVRRGLVKDYAEIVLDGGNLHIEWRDSDNCVYMTGPTAFAFDGVIGQELLNVEP